ncbi:MAG: LrgB family protein [Chromatiales bacterium]|nr:LrgB family protein [Chromatiales bacterium]
MAEQEFFRLWVYLSTSPLLWLTVTLVVYQIAYVISKAVNNHPLLNPVAVTVAALIGLLELTDTSFIDYFDGAQFIHFLLGPATVALAVPLYNQLSQLRRLWLPLATGLIVGVAFAGLSAVGIAKLLGASQATLLSLAPKSVTAPIAMGVAEKIGGLPSLTAALVVMTGIIGAVVGNKLFDLLRVREDSIRGFALGLTSHGIGTARAFQLSEEMGAFSGLAMALSAFTTALLLPWLLAFLGIIN